MELSLSFSSSEINGTALLKGSYFLRCFKTVLLKKVYLLVSPFSKGDKEGRRLKKEQS